MAIYEEGLLISHRLIDNHFTMTIFGKRVYPLEPAAGPSPAAGASHNTNVKASTPRATTPRPILEQDLFEDIVFPEDDDNLMECDENMTSVSECNMPLDRRHSEDSSDIHSSNWDDSKSCSETTPSATHSTSGSSLANHDTTEPTTKRPSSCRFSKEARSVLRTWYHEHRSNPYPTSAEKDQLVLLSGLKRSQIALWLANTRRKDRARANERAKAAAAPPKDKSWPEMNPFDRWKVTPIELEAVAPPVILAACEDNPMSLDPIAEESQWNDHDYPRSLFSGLDNESTANFSTYDAYFAQSMASYDTGFTSLLDASISDATSFSYNPLHPQTYPLTTHPSLPPHITKPHPHPHPHRERRRRRTNTKPPLPSTSKLTKNASTKPKPFHCTFHCSSSFATKHDWARHEKSQHLSLETWVCCASGATILSPPPSSHPVCAFCDEVNPDQKHLESHNYSACQVKEYGERTFYRKDHFMQHLRLTHECRINPRMGGWKSEVREVKARCGFCDANFDTWAQRAEHLAGHFKQRVSMDSWTGGWGFEPEILALVEKADLSASPGLGDVPQLVHSVGNMAPPAVPQNLPIKASTGVVSIAGGEFLRPHEVQLLNNSTPLFSQQEMDEAAAALSASLNGGQQLPLDMSGLVGTDLDVMSMGFDGGGGGMMGVDGLPMQVQDFNVQDLMAGMGTDVVDWAQFAA